MHHGYSRVKVYSLIVKGICELDALTKEVCLTKKAVQYHLAKLLADNVIVKVGAKYYCVTKFRKEYEDKMSTNAHLYAVRQVRFTLPSGDEGTDFQEEKWQWQYQTPTDLTYRMLESQEKDGFKAGTSLYAEYITKLLPPEEEAVYADDDYFCVRPSIGIRMVDRAQDHLKELQAWIENKEAKGFTLEWEAL